jgi:hypothetical protein
MFNITVTARSARSTGAVQEHTIIYMLMKVNHNMIRERATGIMGRASHTSEYSEVYSGGFDDPLFPSEDDVSPCCDRFKHQVKNSVRKRKQRSPALYRQGESQSPFGHVLSW